jgi:hypothetical protein
VSQTVGEHGLDNARGIRRSYRIIIITWLSEGGIPRVLSPTPQLLYTPATLSSAAASLWQWRSASGQAYPGPARVGRPPQRSGGRREAHPGPANHARLSQRLSPQGRLESGVHTPTRATEHMNPLATPRAGQLDHSRPPNGGFYLRLWEHADASRPHPEPLRCRVASALSGHRAPQAGVCLSEGALCLRAPP